MRADCGQSTLALVVPPFFLSCLSCRFPFVLVLPRDSLGNGLRGFGAAECAIWRRRLAAIIAAWPARRSTTSTSLLRLFLDPATRDVWRVRIASALAKLCKKATTCAAIRLRCAVMAPIAQPVEHRQAIIVASYGLAVDQT
jgi:hypothetical protein